MLRVRALLAVPVIIVAGVSAALGLQGCDASANPVQPDQLGSTSPAAAGTRPSSTPVIQPPPATPRAHASGGNASMAPVTITVSVSRSDSQTSPVCQTAEWMASGAISSDRPVAVTYQWARSDGTRTAPATVRVSPGASARPIDYPPAIVGAPGLHRYTDTLQVTSPLRLSDSYSFSYSCKYLQLAITTASLPGATNGGQYNVMLSASGGDGTYRWSATGLPPGLSINPATGVVSGPVNVDTSGASSVAYNVFVTVTDGEPTAQLTERPFVLIIHAPAQAGT